MSPRGICHSLSFKGLSTSDGASQLEAWGDPVFAVSGGCVVETKGQNPDLSFFNAPMLTVGQNI